jgi:hypothetical protein
VSWSLSFVVVSFATVFVIVVRWRRSGQQRRPVLGGDRHLERPSEDVRAA